MSLEKNEHVADECWTTTLSSILSDTQSRAETSLELKIEISSLHDAIESIDDVVPVCKSRNKSKRSIK